MCSLIRRRLPLIRRRLALARQLNFEKFFDEEDGMALRKIQGLSRG